MTTPEEQAADVLGQLVRAYYGPLGWDLDELDPDDLRECMKAMEPVAAYVVEAERAAAERGWEECFHAHFRTAEPLPTNPYLKRADT